MSYQSTVAAEAGLLHYFKQENGSGNDTDVINGAILDKTVAGSDITPGSAGNGSWTGLGGATCWSFGGATAGAVTGDGSGTPTALSTLNGLTVVTFECIAYINSYPGGDNLLAELSANWNSNNGFIIDPDESSGKCGIGSNDHAGHVWFDEFTQPSAAAWHHWMIVFDRATPINKAIIDGTSQTLTGGTHAAPVAFDAEALFVMCRNHTGLRTAGKMGQLAIYSGDKSSVAASHFAALSPGTAPTADFTGTPLSGSSPLSVAFTDTSTNEGGSPTFLWQKNDGSGWVNFAGTPTAQNPTETFS